VSIEGLVETEKSTPISSELLAGETPLPRAQKRQEEMQHQSQAFSKLEIRHKSFNFKNIHHLPDL
jgi:hypothetical protein